LPSLITTNRFTNATPVLIGLHEWIAIARDLIHSRNTRKFVGSTVGPPLP
jgi:hypothetical protein